MSFRLPTTVARRLAAAGLAALLALTAAAGISAAPAHARVMPVVTANPAVTVPAADYIAAQWVAKDPLLTNGLLADAILGLAASETHQTEVLQMVAQLKTEAAGYATGPAPAAKLALVAAAMGEDARNFGGVDLIKIIQDGVATDPTAGGFFGPALVVLGLARNGETVPQAVIDELLETQGPDGSFGYIDTFNNNAYVADPDFTGIAMAALSLIPTAPGVATSLPRVISWAQNNQTNAHWASFSPANTAGILGSSLNDEGVDVSATLTWLSGQQLADGGLPNVENGTTSDLYATVQGILLFSQSGLATVVFVPAATTAPTPTPTPTGTATPASPTPSAAAPTATSSVTVQAPAPTTTPVRPGLPDTGADGGLLPVIVIAAGTGVALALAGRRR